MLALLAIALGLGFLIGTHELSHMLVAKKFGVKVLKFSFGFGPILLLKEIGETSYELRLLPLGGFIQCEGESSDTKVERGFFSTSWWKRCLIALAGPTTNLILGYLIILAILLFNQWPFFLAIGRAYTIVKMIIGLTLSWLIGFFYHTSKVSELSGPIAVTKIMMQSFRESIIQFFFVLSAISVSLGLFNLFPVMGLDGGHVLLYTIEGLRRKTLPMKVYEIWNYLGFVLLISLMVFVTIMDLLK